MTERQVSVESVGDEVIESAAALINGLENIVELRSIADGSLSQQEGIAWAVSSRLSTGSVARLLAVASTLRCATRLQAPD